LIDQPLVSVGTRIVQELSAELIGRREPGQVVGSAAKQRALVRFEGGGEAFLLELGEN
jgi:hypothetical protein